MCGVAKVVKNCQGGFFFIHAVNIDVVAGGGFLHGFFDILTAYGYYVQLCTFVHLFKVFKQHAKGIVAELACTAC